jgi:hypothetical protein
VVPEPEAAPDPVAEADGAIEGLAPFRAVGVFVLPPPPEEASRWSSALSASALQPNPKRHPNTSVAGPADREGEDVFEWGILARALIRTSVVQLRHVLLQAPSSAKAHNLPIRGPQIAKRVV